MSAFRRILFPFDFSDAATALATPVSEMAERFDATVAVLHAFNRIRNYDLAPHMEQSRWIEPGSIPYSPEVRRQRDHAEMSLRDFARRHLTHIRSTCIVADGDPASVIEWAAKREQADLIMMSTRGKGKFRRMLPGSVTTKVLHDVEIPVFTSAHVSEAPAADHDLCHTILCPLRIEVESEITLRVAALLARAFKARLCLLYVGLPGDPRSTISDESVLQFFEHAVGPAGADDLSVRCRTMNAPVSEGIRNTAIDEAADLVVVGRGHAKTHKSRLWTNLYTVIRESPCPVLSL